MNCLLPICDACGKASTIDMVGNFKGLFHRECWQALLNGIEIVPIMSKAAVVSKVNSLENFKTMERIIKAHKWSKPHCEGYLKSPACVFSQPLDSREEFSRKYPMIKFYD